MRYPYLAALAMCCAIWEIQQVGADRFPCAPASAAVLCAGCCFLVEDWVVVPQSDSKMPFN